MTNKAIVSKLDFSGQRIFVGMDVHKNNWTVTIRMNHLHLKTFSMNPDSKELFRFLQQNYPNASYHSVYEAGFSGYWAHYELISLGIKNIIVHAADVPTTGKEKNNKKDPVDSRKLSRELENHSLSGIFIPTPKQQSLRSLSRLRYQNVKKRIQTKVRIKSFLHFQGIKIPKKFDGNHWFRAFVIWLKAVPFQEPYNQEIMDSHIEDLEYLRTKMLEILRKIRAFSNTEEAIRNIRSVPGIGLIVAFTLFAELIDIHRFVNLDRLVAYLGIIPDIKGSSDTIYVRGIAKRHNRHLRYLLVEAAWSAVRKDRALTMSFSEYLKRMSKQKAIIRITKKLVNRIRYTWKNNTTYKEATVI